MKANELRIGNCVKTQIHGVGAVEAISETKILYSSNYDSLNIEYFEPIPLTEERLLRFGFIKNDWTDNGKIIYYGWQNGTVLLETDSNNSFFVLDGKHGEFNNIEHVHQIQNLYFALTNKELTIK